jgi:hypothetical protein
MQGRNNHDVDQSVGQVSDMIRHVAAEIVYDERELILP